MYPIKYRTQSALILVVVVAAVVIANLFRFGCLLETFFAIPCPGCGMTAAVLALLRGDLTAAFTYHPMVFSLPILFLYFWQDERVFRSRKVNNSVLVAIWLGFSINYIYTLINHFST